MNAGIKPGTWLDHVARALRGLGGEARFMEICDVVEKRRPRRLTSRWVNTVAKTIQTHSSDSRQFASRLDVFESANGIGQGVWRLRPSFRKGPNL